MTAASVNWDDLVGKAAEILRRCEARGLRIATAESCTGGLIAGAFTEVPGSSSVFERGFVTYSNEAKSELLGVPAELIAAEGAVSEVVARAMAKGALRASRATLAVSVTGVAGPGGGSVTKPVGLVHFGGASMQHVIHRVERFGDLDRRTIRLKSVAVALDLLASLIEEEGVQATP